MNQPRLYLLLCVISVLLGCARSSGGFEHQEYTKPASRSHHSSVRKSGRNGSSSGKVVISASIYQSVKRGLGHRFIDLAMTVTFARKLNVTRSLMLSEWSTKGEHGGYSFFPAFAGLSGIFHTIIPPYIHVTIVSMENWTMNMTAVMGDSGASGASSTDVLPANITTLPCFDREVVLRSCDRCCDPSRQMCDVKTSLRELQAILPVHFDNQLSFGDTHRFATVQSLLLQRSPHEIAKSLQTLTLINSTTEDKISCLAIVAHIRVGDRKLGCNFENGETIADVVVHVVRQMKVAGCVAVYYMTNDYLSPTCLENITTTTRQVTNVNAYLLLERDVEQSLKMMIAADVLVSSGSSFTRVPAVLSRWALHLTPTISSVLDGDITYSFNPALHLTLPFSLSAEETASEESGRGTATATDDATGWKGSVLRQSHLLPTGSPLSPDAATIAVGSYMCYQVALRRNKTVCLPQIPFVPRPLVFKNMRNHVHGIFKRWRAYFSIPYIHIT
jgi:hypothetical protein